MTNKQFPNSGRNTVFLSSLNVLIDELSKLLDEYKRSQLSFANDIYSSDNGHVFDPKGQLEYYQMELKDIVEKLENQLSGLQEVQKQLKS